MLIAVDWWTRNSPWIQALSTIVLVLVTAVYAYLTRRISTASVRQAAAAELQLEQAREALKAQQQAAQDQLEIMQADVELQRAQIQRSDQQAQSVLVESAKARLSTLTPTCTVMWDGSRMRQRDDTSIGAMTIEEFDRSFIRTTVSFSIRNDGSSPALVTVLPVDFGESNLSTPPTWDRTVHEEILPGGSSMSVAYLIDSAGVEARRLGYEHRRLTFEFETKSPLTGVTDRHHWIGTYGEVAELPGSGEPQFDHANNDGISGSSIAYPIRIWPSGFGEE